MKTTKSLKKNFIVYSMKTLFSVFFPLLSFRIISTSLGTTGVGQIQFSQSIVSYFQLFASLGVSSYAIREGAKIRDDKELLGKLSTEIVIINLITTFISYLFFCLFIFNCHQMDSYRNIILILGMDIFLVTFNIEWLFGILEEYTYISIRSVIFQIISFVVVFMLVHTPNDTILYALILEFTNIAILGLNLFASKRYINFFKNKNYNIKKHIKPILMIFGASVASSIYMSLDSTMLGFMKNEKYVGLYAAASKLKKALTSVITSVCSVFLARLSFYLENDKNKYNLTIRKVMSLMGVIAIPASVGLFCLSKESIIILSGNGFIEANNATKILSGGIIISIIDNLLIWHIMLPNRQEKIIMYSTILSLITDFILNLIFIPKYGVEGAAFATVLSELVVFIIALIKCKQMGINVKLLFKNFTHYIIGGVLCAVICSIVNIYVNSALLCVSISVFIFGIIYIILLLVLKNSFICDIFSEMKITIKRKMHIS